MNARTLPGRALVPLVSILAGVPMAWFVQLVASYAATSTPCFYAGARIADPAMAAPGLAASAVLVVSWACAILSVIASLVALRILRRDQNASGQSHAESMDVGERRLHFVAVWATGVALSFGGLTLFNAIALSAQTPCAS